MESSIYRYILRHSLPRQIVMTVLSVASFPFLYAFYELPKMIVNGAIQGKGVTYPVEALNFRFSQLDYLFLLCGVFLALVFVNQSFKYYINVYRGVTGERMLRRLRFDLYSRILRFPLPVFRRKSPGEIIAMITAEVEPLGGFIGDAFSVPVFQGGTLLVILGFLLYQNPVMAGAAIALYPLQFYVIPKLQRKVNLMAKERVRLVRRLSERIGETVGGVSEIHANGTALLELAAFSQGGGAIYEIRLKIYIWKFLIKFINNSINHLGPFFFYSIGGYLVITGGLEIGTLVASLAAHKDLAAPWKELLNYYQRREDARIKYEQIIEQFELPSLIASEVQTEVPASIKPLTGPVSASNLSLIDDSGQIMLDGANFSVNAPEHVAIVGPTASGKEALGLVLGRLLTPTAGRLNIGDQHLADLPETVSGNRIGYVGEGAYLFSATVKDNLFYGLKQRPPADDGEEEPHWRAEAEASGNSIHDPDGDWIDRVAAGADDDAALTHRAIDTLALVDMERDIYELGLRGSIDPETQPELAARILEARAAFQKRLADADIAALVEPFDENHYNRNATMAENLLFGTPLGGAFDMDRLAEHPYVKEILDKAGLTDDLLEAGHQVAATMVELFADLPPGHEFFQQFSFIDAEDLPEYQSLLSRIAREGIDGLRPEERTQLLSLPFRLVPARHRLDIIDEALEKRLLAARKLFAENLPESLAGAVEFFNSDRYNAAATLQDNILFGKPAYGQARGAERVSALIGEIIEDLDMRLAVMEVGLGYEVGIAGSRLSSSQRQKLALARALLKRPDIMVLNNATAALDAGTQARIVANVRREMAGHMLFWVIGDATLAHEFDRIIVMDAGKVVAISTPAELEAGGTSLAEMMDRH